MSDPGRVVRQNSGDRKRCGIRFEHLDRFGRVHRADLSEVKVRALNGLNNRPRVVGASAHLPFSSIVTIPSSRTPARSHFWTSRMMRLSPIRCSRKRTNHSCETSVKNDRISASSMKFTFVLLIPTMSASSASCGPARHPERQLLQDRSQSSTCWSRLSVSRWQQFASP
jgi:hypothetical protein